MSKIVSRILSISVTGLSFILVVILLYNVGRNSYTFGYRVYTEPPVASGKGQDMIVRLDADDDDKSLAMLLEEKGVIRDWKLFYIQEKLKSFKPGRGIYTVSTTMTADELMEALTPEVIEEEVDEENSLETLKEPYVEPLDAEEDDTEYDLYEEVDE